MKLMNEKKEIVYKYRLEDISKEEYARLRSIGLEQIQKDDEALINYAVIYILTEQIKKLDNNVDTLKKVKKTKTTKAKNQELKPYSDPEGSHLGSSTWLR